MWIISTPVIAVGGYYFFGLPQILFRERYGKAPQRQGRRQDEFRAPVLAGVGPDRGYGNWSSECRRGACTMVTPTP